MSTKVIIAIIVGLVVAGGAAFIVLGSGEDEPETSNVNQEVIDAENPADDVAPPDGDEVFNPVNSLQEDFKAVITTETNAGVVTGDIEHDADGTIRFTGVVADKEVESIVTQDALYSQVNGKWFKFPISQSANLGFSRADIEVTPDELGDFRKAVVYKGTADCPAGTCDLWVAKKFQGNDSLQIFISKKDNTFSQIISETKDGKVTVVYSFDDVNIDVPTNAQSLTLPQ